MLYKKQWVVVEYCPGLQGFSDEFVGSYTFDNEEQAKKFAKQKQQEAYENRAWLSYRIQETFVPAFEE